MTTIPGSAAAWVGGATLLESDDASSLHPTASRARPASTRERTSGLQRAADRGLELVHGIPVSAERAQVLELGFSVRALSVEQSPHAQPSPAIRELYGGPGPLGSGQVEVAETPRLVARGVGRRVRSLDLRSRLVDRRLQSVIGPAGLGDGPCDLTLVPVEDAKRNADPDAEGVVLPDPLVLHQGREVPPRVGAGKIDVRARLVARRLGRPDVRAQPPTLAEQSLAVERHVAEGQIPVNDEVLCERLLTDRRSQRDAGRERGLPRVGEIALEGKPLDLYAEQLQVGDVSLLGPQAGHALDLVDGAHILGRELDGRLGGQQVSEGLLDLGDNLPPGISQVELADPRRRPCALDPTLPLAAGLDGLGERDRVLRVDAGATELLDRVRD